MATKTYLFTFPTNTVQSWTLPSDCNTQVPVTIICIGGGSGAQGQSTSGWGGGGGGWSQSDVNLTDGQTLWIHVGGGGAGSSVGANATVGFGTNSPGGKSWVNLFSNAEPTSSSQGVLANGGSTLSPINNNGGALGIGNITYRGGNGGNGAGFPAGGGGGGGGAAGGPFGPGKVGADAAQGITGSGGGGGGGTGGSGVGSPPLAAGGGGRGGIGFNESVGGAPGAGTGGAGGNAPTTYPTFGGGGGGGGGRSTGNGVSSGNGGAGMFSGLITVDFENGTPQALGALQGPGGGGGGGGGHGGTNSTSATAGSGGNGRSGGGGGSGGTVTNQVASNIQGSCGNGGDGLVFIIYDVKESPTITTGALTNCTILTDTIISLNDQLISDLEIGGGPAHAYYFVTSGGQILESKNAGGINPTTLEQWCTPANRASAYEVRITDLAGSTPPQGDAFNTWLPLTSTRSWFIQETFTGQTQTATFTVQIRRAGTTTVLDSAFIDLIVEVS